MVAKAVMSLWSARCVSYRRGATQSAEAERGHSTAPALELEKASHSVPYEANRMAL